MKIEAKVVGGRREEEGESEICEFCDTASGLSILVESYTKGKPTQKHRVTFENHNGYRVLDEGDLIRYERSEAFNQPYCVYEIIKGGWSNGEITEVGILDTSKAVSVREWFIATTNMCASVLSNMEPKIENV